MSKDINEINLHLRDALLHAEMVLRNTGNINYAIGIKKPKDTTIGEIINKVLGRKS